jgi:very-short-patch-repair endonuclease
LGVDEEEVARVVVGQVVRASKVARAKEFRRSMTRAEGLLWQELRTNRLRGLHFRRQQVIAGLIVDFYCHAAGLVVEVDGGVHAGQVEYDEERDRVLAARGSRVLRVRNEDVEGDIGGVLERIVAEAGRRGVT